MNTADDFDADDYLSRGLCSVTRRQRAKGVGLPACTPVAAEPEEDPVELAGYPVVRRIGRGGMGVVYRVRQTRLERELAIKVLTPRYAADREMIRRFDVEVRICGRLQHPGVVPVHDSGRLEDGRPYFTMKVVEGETLAELLAARSDPDGDRGRFLDVFERVCQTLAYVHSEGVVHGDVKSSNVMVGEFGEVQVMDWGFARVMDGETVAGRVLDRPDTDASGSSTSRALGTPAYMAPEQARGDEAAITPRTDVFGLGAILCEILTGRPPYRGETRSATYLQAVRCWQEDARESLAACGADPELVDLARRCLAPDPCDRPEDAGRVAAEVAAYLAGLRNRAHEVGIELARAEARAASERRSRRSLTIMASVIVVAVLAVTASLLWIQTERAERQRTAQAFVARALERARVLGDQARAQPVGGLAHWEEALAAVEQAAPLASTSSDAGVVARLTEDLRRGLADARRVRDLAGWLADVRPHFTDDRGDAGVAASYAAGFARFGFRFDADPDRAAALARASPLAVELAAALDEWARVVREADAEGRFWRELVAAARSADPDPFRDRLRVAFLAGDQALLERLARPAEWAGEPAATVDLLARMLFESGARQEAIGVLRRAAVRYPDDFATLHDLGACLARIRPRDAFAHEMLGAFRAAAALRPDDAHVFADLGWVLAFVTGDRDAGLDALRRSLALDPGYARSWFYLGVAQFDAERFEDSRTAFGRAAALGEVRPAAESHEKLAENLVLLGLPDEALDHARTAVRLQPDLAHAHGVLGWTASIAGRHDEAEAALRAGAALDPRDEWIRTQLHLLLDDPTRVSRFEFMPARRQAIAALIEAEGAAPDSARRRQLVDAAFARLWEVVDGLRARLAPGERRGVLTGVRWTQWEPTFARFAWTAAEQAEWDRVTGALTELAERALRNP